MPLSNNLPGDEGPHLRALANALAQVQKKGAELSWLSDRAGGDLDLEATRTLLGELERRGEAVEWNRRWYALRYTDWAVGRLEMQRGGQAVARTGETGEVGLQVKRGDLNGARDGDLVLLKQRRRQRGRGYGLPEASVSKILERRWKSLVGRLVQGPRGWRLEPFDPRARIEVRLQVPQGKGAEDKNWNDGDYAVAALLDRPTRDGKVVGRVTEVLGPLEQQGVDMLAVLRHLEIPEEFPQEVLTALADLPDDPTPEDRAERLDLSELLCITIDGATARDFDDAISVETLENGHFQLGVHIADVSHYVEEGSALDREAFRRGTSVYFPERAVPMLPEKLSNGLCSLRPEVPRLTLSALLEIDREGTVCKRRFARSHIRSARRMTYSEVARLLEAPKPEDEGEYGEVLALLQRAESLRRVLYDRRLAGGSLDLDLPEVTLTLAEDGSPEAVESVERTLAHRLIEEFMIAANQSVSAELSSHDVPAIHRVHEPPGVERYEDLRSALAAIGYTLASAAEAMSPEPFQRLLRQVEGTPRQALVSGLVLRAMQRAVYRADDAGHFALGLRHYTHFTSPIRRYPDLVVHRQLKRRLSGAAAEGSGLEARLDRIAEHASFTERRAERAERDLVKWKKVRFLADRLGDSFTGTITGVQPFGLFIQLDEYLVDGLLPIRRLTDNFYLFEADRQRLVGEASGRIFRLGDSLEVVLTRADVVTRLLDLELPGMPPPRRRRRDRPPPRSLR